MSTNILVSLYHLHRKLEAKRALEEKTKNGPGVQNAQATNKPKGGKEK